MTCSFAGMQQTLPRGGLAGLYLTSSPKLFYFNMGHRKSQLYFLLLNSGRPQIFPAAVDCGCGLKKELGSSHRKYHLPRPMKIAAFTEKVVVYRGNIAGYTPSSTRARHPVALHKAKTTGSLSSFLILTSIPPGILQ